LIPIARPLLGEPEAAAAREAILSGWVTQGPRVAAFESGFARAVGAGHGCAVANGTAALHLALACAGVGPGDVVITVSHSFVATANAVRICGAEPVFVDVEAETFGMDPEMLARLLQTDCRVVGGDLIYNHTERLARGESPLRFFNHRARGEMAPGRVAAILPVHQMGIPCDIVRICEIAAEYRLPVVEDAACAIGSELSDDGGRTWQRIGAPHGNAACFSLHPRKVLTTGDGGMVTTADADIDARLRLLRQHGMSVSDRDRHAAGDVAFESYLTTAYNYRLTDIQAAIGCVQLERLDRILKERRRQAAFYHQRLGGIRFLELTAIRDTVRPNWQSYPVRLARGAPLDQRQVMQALLDRGVATRRGIMNAHQEPPYRGANWNLPCSEDMRDRTILLPLYPGLSDGELETVCRALEAVLG
jgi:dTDP-4-amino-4,6-dideoxygalactose transaminase